MNWRTAKAAECPTCRAAVLRGLDHEVCATEVVVDPEPITEAGEALALLTGRRTYRYWDGSLTLRDWWHITDKTGHRKPQVLAQHVCGCPGLPKVGPDPARPLASPFPDQEDRCPY